MIFIGHNKSFKFKFNYKKPILNFFQLLSEKLIKTIEHSIITTNYDCIFYLSFMDNINSHGELPKAFNL